MTQAETRRPLFFIDSAHPTTVQKAADLLREHGIEPAGITTNPSHAATSIKDGAEDFDPIPESEALKQYHDDLLQIAEIVPEVPVSIQVHADETTTSQEMVEQVEERSLWLPEWSVNKVPATVQGFLAREVLLEKGYPDNLTLVFDSQQIWAARKQVHFLQEEGRLAPKSRNGQQSFISTFFYRNVFEGYDGIGLLKRSIEMDEKYGVKEHPVYVLHASVREPEHIQPGVDQGAYAITAPLSALEKYLSLTDDERIQSGKAAYRGRTGLKPVSGWYPYERPMSVTNTEELNQALLNGDIKVESPRVKKYFDQFNKDWRTVAKPDPVTHYSIPA